MKTNDNPGPEIENQLRRMYVGGIVIVVWYDGIDFDEARTFYPWHCFSDHQNRPVKS